jgi:hypothetical protein
MLGRLVAILTFSRRPDCLTGSAKVIDGDTIVVALHRCLVVLDHLAGDQNTPERQQGLVASVKRVVMRLDQLK